MYCNLILRISEAKIRVNVWSVHRHKKCEVRGGQMAVRGGSTVQSMYVNSQHLFI